MEEKTKIKSLKKNCINKMHNLAVISKGSIAGITLMALIVSIIVLIILAGVSINLILGDNGIITKVQNGRQTQEKVEIIEKLKIEIAAKEAEKLQNTTGITQSEIEEILSKYGTVNKEDDETIKSLKPTNKDYEIPFEEIYNRIINNVIVGEIVTEKNKKYTKNGTAVIPVGFAIVPGLDDVSKGLVISDKANDKNNEGNQFVWIPVDKKTFDAKFKRTEGYWNEELDSMLPDCGEADRTGVNSKITEDQSVLQEAVKMYTSVEANGGFYIGRYEAGTTQANGSGIRGEVVVKKGADVYDNIGWSDSNTMTNVKGGAVQVARGMYTGKKTANNEIYGVVSTLCYGVQWDAALNFIDPNYITNEVEVEGKLQANCALDSYLVNSTGKGWYKDNCSLGNPNHLTGVDVDSQASNKVKNIYDMAGNLLEWTMESYQSDYRIYRGRLLRVLWF